MKINRIDTKKYTLFEGEEMTKPTKVKKSCDIYESLL